MRRCISAAVPSPSSWLLRSQISVELLDRARRAVVDGDQELRRQEEVHVLGLEEVLPRLEVDAVEDQIQVVAVRLDLRMVDGVERVLDRELVDVEDVGRIRLSSGVGLSMIDPDQDAAVRPAARPGPRGRSTHWSVDPPSCLKTCDQVDPGACRDQSPVFICSAACAAASRATGTRYGEQLT